MLEFLILAIKSAVFFALCGFGHIALSLKTVYANYSPRKTKLMIRVLCAMYFIAWILLLVSVVKDGNIQF